LGRHATKPAEDCDKINKVVTLIVMPLSHWTFEFIVIYVLCGKAHWAHIGAPALDSNLPVTHGKVRAAL